MSKLASISPRIASVHGSAPNMPTCSEHCRGSSPWRANSSAIASMYDGVTAITRGLNSSMSCTWRGVSPPETGTTAHPRRSAPP